MSLEQEHPAEPLIFFARAFAAASAREPFEANAMSLATVDREGHPSVRIVLLKEVDARGFVFFTNYTSNKGKQLDETERAALCWHWPKGAEQVRAEGSIERVSAVESDAYFSSRPRESQLGAWASLQSQTLDNRGLLVQRLADLTKQYEGKSVPRPPHWGGYRLLPHRIEFWYGRESRLHDRHVYDRAALDAPFAHRRLFP